VQQSGTVIPKAQQTHSGPVLDVAWSDVSNHFLLFSTVDGNVVDICKMQLKLVHLLAF